MAIDGSSRATILAERQPSNDRLAYILESRITPNSKNLSDFQVRKDRDKANEILEDPLNTLTRRSADSGRDREIPSHSEHKLVYVSIGEREITYKNSNVTYKNSKSPFPPLVLRQRSCHLSLFQLYSSFFTII